MRLVPGDAREAFFHALLAGIANHHREAGAEASALPPAAWTPGASRPLQATIRRPPLPHLTLKPQLAAKRNPYCFAWMRRARA
jgi:hypothetical protein